MIVPIWPYVALTLGVLVHTEQSALGLLEKDMWEVDNVAIQVGHDLYETEANSVDGACDAE